MPQELETIEVLDFALSITEGINALAAIGDDDRLYQLELLRDVMLRIAEGLEAVEQQQGELDERQLASLAFAYALTAELGDEWRFEDPGETDGDSPGL